MTIVYAIQAGRTTWDDQDRVESAAGAPLTEQAERAIQDAARQLADCKINAVYACAGGQAESRAAELAAGALGVKVCVNKALHELDYGMWQGLTVSEIKRRQPRVYRQWTKSPVSIRPPEGETLDQAKSRLCAVLKEIAKRRKNGSVLLVLRPVLMGLLKCLSEEQALDSLWQYVDTSFGWGRYEVDEKSL